MAVQQLLPFHHLVVAHLALPIQNHWVVFEISLCLACRGWVTSSYAKEVEACKARIYKQQRFYTSWSNL